METQAVFFSRFHGLLNELNDPDNFLKGTGKYRRHLKPYSQEDMETKKVG